MPDVTILALSGSLRRDSHNTRLLHEAERLAPELRFDHFTELARIPLFNEDQEHPTPAAVADLRARIAAADAVLVATPEYNAGIPGGLKNALDWLSRPVHDEPPVLRRKPVAIVGASAGPLGTVRAQMALRQVLHKLDAIVLGQPEFLLASAHLALREPRLPPETASAALLGQVLAGLTGLVRLAEPAAVG
ncbi:NADPH-dependent FMN reductase [Pseudonocardia sp. GCM10023141]|uniref:NADPH-dependent FMN reductase n=1 Tax=Pseudonocardia sp. GCM10023141 TaxID=3252653 RepID=UPI003621A136